MAHLCICCSSEGREHPGKRSSWVCQEQQPSKEIMPSPGFQLRKSLPQRCVG